MPAVIEFTMLSKNLLSPPTMSILAVFNDSAIISAWASAICRWASIAFEFDVLLLVEFQFELFVFFANAVEQFHRFGLLRDALGIGRELQFDDAASAVPSFSIATDFSIMTWASAKPSAAVSA